MRAYLLTNGRIVVGQATVFTKHRAFPKAYLVDRWGTTKGFSELQNGPLAGTEFAQISEVSVRDNNILLSIAVSGWPDFQ